MAEIKIFFMVLRPTLYNSLDDICFSCSPRELIFKAQCEKGIQPSDIFGVYEGYHEALAVARDLLGLTDSEKITADVSDGENKC